MKTVFFCMILATAIAGAQTNEQIFNMRSKCGELGEKLLNEYFPIDGNIIISSSQVTAYNSTTNRCYVEIRYTQRIEKSLCFTRDLFDAQTRKELAAVTEYLATPKINFGVIGGMFTEIHQAEKYIDAMMEQNDN